MEAATAAATTITTTTKLPPPCVLCRFSFPSECYMSLYDVVDEAQLEVRPPPGTTPPAWYALFTDEYGAPCMRNTVTQAVCSSERFWIGNASSDTVAIRLQVRANTAGVVEFAGPEIDWPVRNYAEGRVVLTKRGSIEMRVQFHGQECAFPVPVDIRVRMRRRGWY